MKTSKITKHISTTLHLMSENGLWHSQKKTIFEESIGDQTQYCKLADYRLKAICTQLEKSIFNSTKYCEGKEDGLTHF